MADFTSRRSLLLGLSLLGLIAVGATWMLDDAPEAKPTTSRATKASSESKVAARKIGAPRSAQGLTLDAQHDVSADGRPPNARREGIIRTGLGELQELQQMNKAVFDDAAKRWNAKPRVKEIIAQWKALEEIWKTQDDEAKAAVIPRMEATWKEAIGLLREEVEKSAREAEAGVK